MKTISVFDVVGPNMIGPSSSHTAGALRIAQYARKLCTGKIAKVHFTLYGSFADTYRGHGTDRALVAGILGFATEDSRIRDSFIHAGEAGLDYTFTPDFDTEPPHPNAVAILLTDQNGRHTRITGISTGGGHAEITNINGVEVAFTGEYCTLLIEHTDKPGVIAYITKCLSDNMINIAYLKLYREEKGKTAYCIAEADEIIDYHILDKIKEHDSIHNAILIQ